MMLNLNGGAGKGSGGVMAEPAYILLAESGLGDAHEIIRRITLAAEKENLSFSQALRREDSVWRRIGGKMLELGLINDISETLPFFENPSRYCGLSAQKAITIAAKYRALM
jgi:adenylosuccinate lyase